MDGYDISGACEQLREFADVLTNWYVRRSRARFWDEDADAFDTLYTVLEVTAAAGRAAAAAGHRGDLARPHRRALGAPDRLAARPTCVPADAELVAAMDQVREVCSAALVAAQGREAAGAAAAAETDRGRG